MCIQWLGRPQTPRAHPAICFVTYRHNSRGLMLTFLLEICDISRYIMKGTNTCQWLLRSSTEFCGKSCMCDYCGAHLRSLRNGSETRPCTGCFRGVTNNYSLCLDCGYYKVAHRCYMRKLRASQMSTDVEIPIRDV